VTSKPRSQILRSQIGISSCGRGAAPASVVVLDRSSGLDSQGGDGIVRGEADPSVRRIGRRDKTADGVEDRAELPVVPALQGVETADDIGVGAGQGANSNKRPHDFNIDADRFWAA